MCLPVNLCLHCKALKGREHVLGASRFSKGVRDGVEDKGRMQGRKGGARGKRGPQVSDDWFP